MAFTPADQRELYLPLIEGIHETPPFGLFMRNLVARTGARRAFLILTLANAAPEQEPVVIPVSAPRAAQEPPLDFRRLAALGLHQHRALRPGRVYALDEMLDYDDPAQLARQRDALEDMGIRHARWLRVSAGGAADAWLVLVRLREDFSASAVSLLSDIAPHLASALRTLVALIGQRLQTGLAQSALERLGIGQIALDAEGRVMAADALAESVLTFLPEPSQRAGRRLQLLPDVERQLENACATLAAGNGPPVCVLPVDPRRHINLLLRRADLRLDDPAALPAVVGLLRLDRREDHAAGASTLQALHGLSAQEAALAHALSRGEPLVEAGLALGLTAETARNYSKRIYSKTGTSGQADLVRLVFSGLAPFS
ncbi:MAG: LuxR family transcriptional regulator [Novosphingobium sp. 17-62-19]|uniref:helix-turn-helix transcriptional regulator n=1 Tax=Novosphingobium sp. 17-62-19 TaxID=1970406 RepID=UPI000BCD0709|nr:LuxR family transcriptional regulator [Novosphingobium sp. 17-62-19]OZA20029.1 MAG: LuxR family transcriptional regulator [Novosphingobium sp. 17-62-19]OZA72076.1 MAG: LuxR family transcriptional regulator [Sphingomonadales bacterium 39-62-4]HQS95948.1 LuxR family transcriptional regulator [Novosphingobium sp.]